MQDLNKINNLINTEDVDNQLLAHALLIGKGMTEVEANQKVYGLSLRLYLRLVTTLIFQSRMLTYFKDYNGQAFETLPKAYQYMYFSVPKIICMDGFDISIQINNGNYCESDNGYRKLGKTWIKAEWGFPSEEEPLLLNDAEDGQTLESVGSSTIELLQQVIDKHGGINWQATLDLDQIKDF